MSDLLSIGASGVRAYQTALNVVGENIANAGTAGYVRRDTVLRELAPGAGSYPLEVNNRILGGVDATGVSRSWDQFRAAEVRYTGAEAARTEAGIVWLERVENSLAGGGLTDNLTRFFNSAQALAADPTGIAPRAAMIENAAGVAQAFRTTAEGLGAVAADLEATARLSVTELNGLAAGLAKTNAGLTRAREGTNGHAQLLDERDRILDRMSDIASISVEAGQGGIVTVRLNDVGGPVLVKGIDARQIEFATNASGSFAYTLDPHTNPQAIGFRGGSLAGLADADVRVADARVEIDRVATDFAAAVNANQAGGADLDGNDGVALFDATGGAIGFQAMSLDPREIAAARRWIADTPATNAGTGRIAVATDPDAATPALPSLRISVTGGVVTATDPVTNAVVGSAPYTAGQPVDLAGLTITISGAPVDGDAFNVARTGANSRDNGSLASLADARRAGGFEGAVTNLTATNASTLTARRTIAEAQGAIRDGALAARDNVSGVNLDHEAVELLRFQQAYQASSRVIQVARDTIQTILDIG